MAKKPQLKAADTMPFYLRKRQKHLYTVMQSVARNKLPFDPQFFTKTVEDPKTGLFKKIPSCLLAHYAARRDLQRTFHLDDLHFRTLEPMLKRAAEHFGFSYEEAKDIFGGGNDQAGSMGLEMFGSERDPKLFRDELKKRLTKMGAFRR